jgi:hypothetical protein
MRKIYLKKIKNINEKNMKKLNNKYEYHFKKEKKILTNDGFYKFINNKLYKFNINFKIDTENDICFDINEDVRKENIYQIPYDNIEISIEKKTYTINDETSLIIEYYKDKINDFYIVSKTKLNINDYIFKEEISYINDLLI